MRPLLEVEFPYLHLSARDGYTVLGGQLPIVCNGQVIDEFEIEVIVRGGGPRREIPLVREVGERIPRLRDRHIEDSTGVTCLCVQDEYWYRFPEGMNLVEFLRGPVMSFFIAQYVFDQHGKWPFDHRAHGGEGILEFYGSLFGTEDLRKSLRLLELVAAKRVKPQTPCPCESTLPVSECHGDLIRRVRSRVRRHIAAKSLAQTRSLTIEIGGANGR